MSAKDQILEYGFSKVIQKNLEKYFSLSHEIPPGLYGRIVNEVERVVLTETLKHCDGNQVKASYILGINRNTLRKKLQKLKQGEENS